MSDASGPAAMHTAAKPTNPVTRYVRSTIALTGRHSFASAMSFTAGRANSEARVHSSHTTIAIVSVKMP
jgi:hypothetical protein